METYNIRALQPGDLDWVRLILARFWGSARVVTRGRIHQADQLPGFIAEVDREPVGLITYRIEKDACEIVSLNSLDEGRGVGSALVTAVAEAADRAGCRRLWLVTTNDNLTGLGFYYKRGFRLAAVHHGAVEEARKLKPEIPATGRNELPIRDEIELEILF